MGIRPTQMESMGEDAGRLATSAQTVSEFIEICQMLPHELRLTAKYTLYIA
jgi:hypothetical protein